MATKFVDSDGVSRIWTRIRSLISAMTGPGLGKWTATQNKVIGDTSVSFTDSAISSTSTLDLYSETASGEPVNYNTQTLSGTTVIYTFDALTEATTFKLWIRNV